MASSPPITFGDHVLARETSSPTHAGLSPLLSSLMQACRTLSREVNRAGLAGLLGLTGRSNVQGEEVAKLDAFANGIIQEALTDSGQVCCMVSEESADPIPVTSGAKGAPYVVVFDPLDGSSNVDASVGIGTIFGIYHRVSAAGSAVTDDDLLQPGNRQVAAGYVLYGSSTMLVYTTGDGVSGFTLDPAQDTFLCSHPAIQTPAWGGIYSVNEGNWEFWDASIRDYVRQLKSAGNVRGKPYSSRYIGSLVADFHRNLLYGGIFLYPSDRKDPRKPDGKLRLLYEANPLAWVAEQAGGAASNGSTRILGLEPGSIHERVPLFIGSAADVAELERFLAPKI